MISAPRLAIITALLLMLGLMAIPLMGPTEDTTVPSRVKTGPERLCVRTLPDGQMVYDCTPPRWGKP